MHLACCVLQVTMHMSITSYTQLLPSGMIRLTRLWSEVRRWLWLLSAVRRMLGKANCLHTCTAPFALSTLEDISAVILIGTCAIT